MKSEQQSGPSTRSFSNYLLCCFAATPVVGIYHTVSVRFQRPSPLSSKPFVVSFVSFQNLRRLYSFSRTQSESCREFLWSLSSRQVASRFCLFVQQQWVVAPSVYVCSGGDTPLPIGPLPSRSSSSQSSPSLSSRAALSRLTSLGFLTLPSPLPQFPQFTSKSSLSRSCTDGHRCWCRRHFCHHSAVLCRLLFVFFLLNYPAHPPAALHDLFVPTIRYTDTSHPNPLLLPSPPCMSTSLSNLLLNK